VFYRRLKGILVEEVRATSPLPVLDSATRSISPRSKDVVSIATSEISPSVAVSDTVPEIPVVSSEAALALDSQVLVQAESPAEGAVEKTAVVSSRPTPIVSYPNSDEEDEDQQPRLRICEAEDHPLQDAVLDGSVKERETATSLGPEVTFLPEVTDTL
jgi:cell envelope opacity-associated protein A